ncbi:uncharacterized protein LOC119745146 [Patiria miniata]|uniref:LRRCT domain-containing protein n=1 Tax=Patiria miniata TaxID=46514 RepID=A0A914BMF5_PATMI|nr:uncharacterized protein LOC119745146 [Patiria miniata]
MALLQTLLVLLGFMGLLIDGQSVTICPEECECDADRMLVDCTDRYLPQIPTTEIPNGTRSLLLDGNHISEFGDGASSRFAPWLRMLSLADNNLESFSNTTLSKLSRLRNLDLSGNLISDLPQMTLFSLRKLTLSRNELGYLKANTFYGLSHLRELYLDQCSIGSVQKDTFSNLPSLEKLSLEDNFLDVDPVGWFVQTPLQELHMSQNGIPLATAVTQWFGINGTLNFRLLALASNDIQYLPKDVFRDLDSLEVLDLRDNRLTSISKNDFLGLRGLRELRLDDNDLTAIHGESLVQTPELSVLTLDGNRLKSFLPQLFSPIGRITSLSAAFNSLQDIADFNSLPALVSLNLIHNRLPKLPNIQNLTSLQILSLSHNQITSIDEETFHLNTELQEIYLDYNGLVFLEYELFEGLQSLHTLTLGGNSWWCDCRLAWMQDLMWSDEQPPWAENLAYEITCTKPEELKDESLEYVSQEVLQQQCPDLQLGVVVIVLFSIWFSVLGFLTTRFWIRKYMNHRKFKRHCRKNWHYSRRVNRRRKMGVSEGPFHILPAATKFAMDHHSICFPLQRRGHVYLEIDTSDRRLNNVFRENGGYSETVVSSVLPHIRALETVCNKLDCLSTNSIKKTQKYLVEAALDLMRKEHRSMEKFSTLQFLWLCIFYIVIIGPAEGHLFVCVDTISLCNCDPTKLSVNCSALGFRAVPKDDISNVTSSLSFGGNFLTAMLRDTFGNLGSLLSLSVENNQIAYVESGSFDRTRELKYLDLSGNRLAVVPSALNVLALLRVLNLSSNGLSSVSTEDFKSFTQLHTLRLENNNLYSIPETTFYPLANLELLYLDHNFISADPIGWFANSTRLTKLRISNNRIPLSASVEDWFGVTWQILPLEELDLAKNAIQQILERTFRSCANLKELHLGGNEIETIAPLSFADLTKLEELTLDRNRLSDIPEDLFLYTENLLSLSLMDNSLTVLSRNVFEGLEQTVSLNLAGNEFTNLFNFSSGADSPLLLPAIKNLYLNSNWLTDVPDIRMFSNLEILNLSDNAIREMEPYAFNGTSLRLLYLNDNLLTTMSYENFQFLPALEVVTITGNPWVCDCRMFWIRDPEGEDLAWRSALYEDVFCIAPDVAKNLNLHSLYILDGKERGNSGPFSPCETADWLSIVIIVAIWVVIISVALGCYLNRLISYRKGYVSRRMKAKVVKKVPQARQASPAPEAPSSAACLNEGATFEDLDKSTTTDTTYVLTSARGHDDDEIETPEQGQSQITEQPKRKKSVDNPDLPVTVTSTV